MCVPPRIGQWSGIFPDTEPKSKRKKWNQDRKENTNKQTAVCYTAYMAKWQVEKKTRGEERERERERGGNKSVVSFFNFCAVVWAWHRQDKWDRNRTKLKEIENKSCILYFLCCCTALHRQITKKVEGKKNP